MVFFAEAYFSAMLRYGVFDAEGKRIGRLQDIYVRSHERFPEITRLAVRLAHSKQDVLVPWALVRNASPEGIRLDVRLEDLLPSPAEPDELALRTSLMDKQIVDVSGRRLVRVHDLKLGAVGNRVLLTHADVGTRGVLRRLGWEHFFLGVCRLLHVNFSERLIPWEHFEMPGAKGELHMDRTREALQRMHPADLADIAEELSAPDRAALLGAMDEEVAADTMQEMEPQALVAAVNELPDEQAAGLIGEMDPDAGADLLADLPEDRVQALLARMEPEEAEDLRKLLIYQEDSAGGLMTSEMVAIPAGIKVSQALEVVRREAQELGSLYYVHVVDTEDRLVGMLSLRELISADPEATVDDLMTRDPISVTPETGQVDTAKLVAHYNLLALPVVDEEGKLLGIVTADDAIDAVIPTSWKKRIPKAFAR
ncbi:MAG: magnesium transporter [candidate division WS1 bacterium]|jgi:CBS domain-containing protein/sporulation protein YlmC with PRC-barrel domain|nr:magnesium transporter [candidate division WS1 bacterium]